MITDILIQIGRLPLRRGKEGWVAAIIWGKWLHDTCFA